MGKIIIKNLDDLDRAAAQFLKETAGEYLFAFYGSMGAGKTTFISALCKMSGVVDEISSPTFTIVNEYQTESGEQIFHFDFYRIESIREVMDIGIEEYWYSDGKCYMEWPEKVEGILPEDVLKVYITTLEDGSRSIEF